MSRFENHYHQHIQMMMATTMPLASFPALVINQHNRSGSWREFLWEFELAIDIVKSILGNAWNEWIELVSKVHH